MPNSTSTNTAAAIQNVRWNRPSIFLAAGPSGASVVWGACLAQPLITRPSPTTSVNNRYLGVLALLTTSSSSPQCLHTDGSRPPASNHAADSRGRLRELLQLRIQLVLGQRSRDLADDATVLVD